MNQQISMFDMFYGQEHQKYVRRISGADAAPFIKNIHYSRRVPNITDAFGLFVNGEMIGVVTYGIPASPPLCKGLAGEINKNNVKELNRLVLLPKFNGGGTTMQAFWFPIH